MTSTRAILCVVAPHSGSGKTTFITHLLRSIPGLGCLKVRPIRDPSDGSSTTGGKVGADFYLEEQTVLHHSGKDTYRYAAAGAVQVEMLRHHGGALAGGLNAAFDRFHPATPVVVESSSAVPHLSPATVILVARPPIREMKDSTTAILARVTDLFINEVASGTTPAQSARELCDRYPSLHPRFTWSANLAIGSLPPDMLVRLNGIVHGRS